MSTEKLIELTRAPMTAAVDREIAAKLAQSPTAMNIAESYGTMVQHAAAMEVRGNELEAALAEEVARRQAESARLDWCLKHFQTLRELGLWHDLRNVDAMRQRIDEERAKI